MHTIRFDDLQFDVPPPSPLSAWTLDGQFSTVPIASVRRSVHRHRRDLSWIPATLFVLAALATLCIVATELAVRIDSRRSTRTVTRRSDAKPPAPRLGDVGKSTPVIVPMTHPSRPSADVPRSRRVPGETDMTSPSLAERSAAAGWCDAALQACREGRFDEAQSLATRAMSSSPGRSRGKAVWLLVEYLRQYEVISREAIDRMNAAVVIDLGADHGTGAFVERVGQDVVFFCRGRHVRFTVDELSGFEGVRLRITRQFLATGGKPANDLILAVAHFVKQIDEAGGFDAAGGRALEAARKHLAVASSASDHDVAEHAKSLLSLIVR